MPTGILDPISAFLLGFACFFFVLIAIKAGFDMYFLRLKRKRDALLEEKRQQWRENMAIDWAITEKVLTPDEVNNYMPARILFDFRHNMIGKFKDLTGLPKVEIEAHIDALTCDWRDAYRYYLKCGDWPHPEACELIDKFGWEQAQGVLEIQNILNDRERSCHICMEPKTCVCDLCDLPICDEHAIKIPDRVTSCTICSIQKPD